MMENIKKVLNEAEEVEFLPDAERFLELYDFPRELIEEIVRRPEIVNLDPHSSEVNYVILRLRRGDLTVSVSLRQGFTTPCVMFIHLHHPGENEVAGKKTPAAKREIPQTPAQMQVYFRESGCRVENADEGFRVTYKNNYVGLINPKADGLASNEVYRTLVRKMRTIQSDLAQASIRSSM